MPITAVFCLVALAVAVVGTASNFFAMREAYLAREERRRVTKELLQSGEAVFRTKAGRCEIVSKKGVVIFSVKD